MNICKWGSPPEKDKNKKMETKATSKIFSREKDLNQLSLKIVISVGDHDLHRCNFSSKYCIFICILWYLDRLVQVSLKLV